MTEPKPGAQYSARQYREWVLDVTPDVPVFVPFDVGTCSLVSGKDSARCPGNLMGVYHEGGTDMADAWIAEHPDWRKQYDGIEGG